MNERREEKNRYSLHFPRVVDAKREEKKNGNERLSVKESVRREK